MLINALECLQIWVKCTGFDKAASLKKEFKGQY